MDGSGKTSFALELTRQVTLQVAASTADRPVLLIHLDDFLNPPDVRHRLGRSSAVGFWLDNYDDAGFRRDVLDPLAVSGDGLYRPAPRHVLDARSESSGRRAAPPDTLVIIEGMFLHREGLDRWGYSIFLDVPFLETARRMALRDGTHADPDHPSIQRYVGGQRLYFAAAQPWLRADLVTDNADPLAPRVIPAEEAARRMR